MSDCKPPQAGGGLPPAPFRTYARKYYDAGLSVFPCGKDNGKKPLVPWAKFQNALPSMGQIEAWIGRYPNANIGLITGHLSGITVVDCDDLSLVDEVTKRFGDTPLQVQTPRPGLHLYYQYNGERNKTYIDGLKIDIRGEGGYVIAPPSVSPIVTPGYVFLKGGLEEVQSLSCIPEGILEESRVKNTVSLRHGEIVSKGQRNTALFNELRRRAKECPTIEDLEEIAFFNNECLLEPPLTQTEVTAIARSVWQYKETGNLIVPGDGWYVQMQESEIEVLKSNPRAFILLAYLKMHHKGIRERFVICDESLSLSLGWSKPTVNKARHALLKKGLLSCIYKGGRHKGDVSWYRLG